MSLTRLLCQDCRSVKTAMPSSALLYGGSFHWLVGRATFARNHLFVGARIHGFWLCFFKYLRVLV